MKITQTQKGTILKCENKPLELIQALDDLRKLLNCKEVELTEFVTQDNNRGYLINIRENITQ